MKRCVTLSAVRTDAIAPGNKLTFQQIYDLAKTEEGTKAQMEAKTADSSQMKIKETHSQHINNVAKHSTPQGAHKHLKPPQETQKARRFQFKYNGSFRCVR